MQRPTNQPAIDGLDRPATVFLSYARKDAEAVKDLQLRLKVRGVRCWRDVDDMPVGSHTESEITQAIEHDSDAIALFLTPNFLKSEFIWRVEAPAALRRHVHDPQFHLVPILLGVTFAEVRQFCRDRNIMDITSFNGLLLTEDGAAGISREEQNKKRNEAARRILHSAFAVRLRRVNADRSYAPSLFLRTFVFESPTDSLDLALDWVQMVHEKEQTATLQEWDELLWPALLDVKHTISEKVLSHRMHLFVKGLLPIAIALGFVLRESTRMTLLLEGQKETWSTETHPSEKEPLRNEWIDDDQGDPRVAVIEVAASRSTKQGVAATLPGIGLKPKFHIRLTTAEFSRESVSDAAHARAIAQQVGRVCQELCDERGVRHLHLFVAIPVELAVLIGHQLNALCPITLYEFKNDEGVYTPIGILR
jgi:SMODS-associated and fused to various effectors sensor domain/TIR domain